MSSQKAAKAAARRDVQGIKTLGASGRRDDLDWDSLSPEAAGALTKFVNALCVDSQTAREEDAGGLSENYIAGVVDGASQKGIEMRHLRKVEGPYEHHRPAGAGFRNRAVLIDGKRKWLETFGTFEEANKQRRGLEAGIEREISPSIAAVLDEYESYMEGLGNGEDSVANTMQRIRSFFRGYSQEDIAEDNRSPDWLERRACALTAAAAATLKRALDARPGHHGRPLARYTRRMILNETKTFARWAQERGHLASNVFEKVRFDDGRGPKRSKAQSRGKPQLRDHEEARWREESVKLAKAGDTGALAVLVALDGGLRSGEVTKRRVRDLERDGHVLVVDWAKSAAGDRQTLDFDDDVAVLLKRQARGKSPTDWLFPEAYRPGQGRPRDWMRRASERICRAAGVTRVTPHGLRGTKVSRLLNQLVEVTGWTVGHESGEVTKRHYLPPHVLRQVEHLLRRKLRASGPAT